MQRRHLATLGLLLAAAPAFAQAPGWKKIRIGVEGAYPPFSEVGPDGRIKGFDIDIANALCADMKAECSMVQLEFDGMIPALKARKFDAVIASISITRSACAASRSPTSTTPRRPASSRARVRRCCPRRTA